MVQNCTSPNMRAPTKQETIEINVSKLRTISINLNPTLAVALWDVANVPAIAAMMRDVKYGFMHLYCGDGALSINENCDETVDVVVGDDGKRLCFIVFNRVVMGYY